MRKFLAKIRDRMYEVAVTAEGTTFDVLIDGRSHPVDLIFSDASHDVLLAGHTCYDAVLVEQDYGFLVDVLNHVFEVEIHDPRRRSLQHAALGTDGQQVIQAKMPGRIVKLLVAEGEEVAAGAGLLILEAMKMQNEIRAPRDGKVTTVSVKEGDAVESGQQMLVIE
jgi:biotin carboxyl carrier protein